MDSIDSSIMDALKENSRITASEISKRVNLSIPAVTERIRKLEEAFWAGVFSTRVLEEELRKRELFNTRNDARHEYNSWNPIYRSWSKGFIEGEGD